MTSNKLVLNKDKMVLLIISNDPDLKKELFLTAQPKNVTPSQGFTYLGIEVSENLKWNYFLEEVEKKLTKALKKRIWALRHIKKFANFESMKFFANGIFLSKLLYGVELWGGPIILKRK